MGDLEFTYTKSFDMSAAVAVMFVTEFAAPVCDRSTLLRLIMTPCDAKDMAKPVAAMVTSNVRLVLSAAWMLVPARSRV